jgi:hypothetical protein
MQTLEKRRLRGADAFWLMVCGSLEDELRAELKNALVSEAGDVARRPAKATGAD